MSANLASVTEFMTPRAVVVKTQSHLRTCGEQGLEGMALWAGRIEGARCLIAEAIIPLQQGHRTEHGLAVSVPGAELHRINMWLHRNELRLVAQIHSHPTEAYHSDTDDRYVIATTLGSLSIVVPDFAARPFRLDDCAAYRLSPQPWWHFSKGVCWRPLQVAELVQTLKVTT